MKEMKDDAKYKDIVTIAEARLNSARKDTKKLTEAQVGKILSDIRLSIITANREQMTRRLIEIEGILEREHKNRLDQFKSNYDEMKKRYNGWPETLKAMDLLFTIRRNAVELLYQQQRLEAQRFYVKAFSALGPAVDDVTGTFMNLGLEYDDIEKRKIPDLNREADATINLNQFREGAGAVYGNEKGKIMLVLSDDRIEILTLALRAAEADREKSGSERAPDDPVVLAQDLADKIKKEQENLDQGTYSAAETARRVDAMHKIYTANFSAIRNIVEPEQSEGKQPERIARAEDKKKRGSKPAEGRG